MSVKYIHLAWTQARDVAENRLLVLLALADWANDEGFCWPTMQTLANKARIAVSTARALIRSLERDGYLTTEIGRGLGHHNTYTLHIPPLVSARTKPPSTGDLYAETANDPAISVLAKSPTETSQNRQPDAIKSPVEEHKTASSHAQGTHHPSLTVINTSKEPSADTTIIPFPIKADFNPAMMQPCKHPGCLVMTTPDQPYCHDHRRQRRFTTLYPKKPR